MNKGMSGKLRPKTWKTKSRKTKTVVFFREIMKHQLSLCLSGKMNEMNALTLQNNNLVVFFFPGMAKETISGCCRVGFSLCTKVCGKKAK